MNPRNSGLEEGKAGSQNNQRSRGTALDRSRVCSLKRSATALWRLLDFTPIFDMGSCEQHQSGDTGVACCSSKQSRARAIAGRERPIRASSSNRRCRWFLNPGKSRGKAAVWHQGFFLCIHVWQHAAPITASVPPLRLAMGLSFSSQTSIIVHRPSDIVHCIYYSANYRDRRYPSSFRLDRYCCSFSCCRD
jgi:hypothetical protein